MHLCKFNGSTPNLVEERMLTSQSPSIAVEFSVQYNLKITSVMSLGAKFVSS